MKAQSLVALSLAISLLAGCEQKQTTTKSTSSAQSNETTDHAAQEQHQMSGQLTLDYGKKWKANTETTQGIQKMSTMANQATSRWQTKDYHELKTKLDLTLTEILQQCTMTGEAHEQLHNYLMPLQKIIAQLGSDDRDQCEQSRLELVQHLKEYDQYFE